MIHLNRINVIFLAFQNISSELNFDSRETRNQTTQQLKMRWFSKFVSKSSLDVIPI